MITKAKRLLFSATIKDSSVVFVGNLISSVLGIIFTVLAARFLGPSNWGLVAGVGSLITILVALGDIGLGSAFFQVASGRWEDSAEREKIKRTYRDLFSLRLLTGIILFLILLAFSGFLSRLIFHSDNYLLMVFTALGFIASLLLDFQIFSIESKRDWKAAAILISLSNVFRIGFLAALYLAGKLTTESVLFVFSGSLFLVFLASLFFVGAKPKLSWSVAKTYKEVFKFSSWMGLNKIVSTASPRLDILLIIQLAGTYEAGIYGAASRLAVGIPMIVGSLATIIASRFALISDRNELRKYFSKSVGLSLVMSAIVLLGVLVAPLVISLFGDQYEQSGSVLQWLLVVQIPFVLSMPAVNILIYHFKMPKIITILSFLQLPTILLVNLLLIPKISIFAPIVALGIINMTTLVVAYYYALRKMGDKK